MEKTLERLLEVYVLGGEQLAVKRREAEEKEANAGAGLTKAGDAVAAAAQPASGAGTHAGAAASASEDANEEEAEAQGVPRSKNGTLRIRLHRASGLPKTDLIGKSDPFVKFTVNEKDCPWVTSDRKDNTQDPVWEDQDGKCPEFELPVNDITDASLRIQVSDHDTFTASDAMCGADWEACNLYDRGADSYQAVELALTRGEAEAGQLFISVTFDPETEAVIPKVNGAAAEKSLAEVEEAPSQAADAAAEGVPSPGVCFELEPYKGGVTFVHMRADDVEVLESDQLAVQAMAGSRYRDSFGGEIEEWQDKLGKIADVSETLAEVQRLWRYLEPLFMHSKECQRELPEDAARFREID